MGRLHLTPISVDDFRLSSSRGVSLFFLSHMHADHLYGLTPSWDLGPLYCSHVTEQLLTRRFGNLAGLIRPLEMNTPHILFLDPFHKHSMTVTLIDARHCPGAVLFIFQGYFGTVVYTGDFRYCAEIGEDIQRCIGESGRVDTLYLDTTYCRPGPEAPLREELLSPFTTLLNENQDRFIYLGMDTLGKEELIQEAAKSARDRVSVSAGRASNMNVLGLGELVTTYQEEARVRVVYRQDLSREVSKLLAASISVLGILVSAWPGSVARASNMEEDGDEWGGFTDSFSGGVCAQDMRLLEARCRTETVRGDVVPGCPHITRVSRHIVRVPYSAHSTLSELRACVSLLKPCCIVPLTPIDPWQNVEQCFPGHTQKPHSFTVPDSIRRALSPSLNPIGPRLSARLPASVCRRTLTLGLPQRSSSHTNSSSSNNSNITSSGPHAKCPTLRRQRSGAPILRRTDFEESAPRSAEESTKRTSQSASTQTHHIVIPDSPTTPTNRHLTSSSASSSSSSSFSSSSSSLCLSPGSVPPPLSPLSLSSSSSSSSLSLTCTSHAASSNTDNKNGSHSRASTKRAINTHKNSISIKRTIISDSSIILVDSPPQSPPHLASHSSSSPPFASAFSSSSSSSSSSASFASKSSSSSTASLLFSSHLPSYPLSFAPFVPVSSRLFPSSSLSSYCSASSAPSTPILHSSLSSSSSSSSSSSPFSIVSSSASTSAHSLSSSASSSSFSSSSSSCLSTRISPPPPLNPKRHTHRVHVPSTKRARATVMLSDSQQPMSTDIEPG